MFFCYFCEEEMKTMKTRYGYVGDRLNCYRHKHLKPHLVSDASLIAQQLPLSSQSNQYNRIVFHANRLYKNTNRLEFSYR